MKKLLIILSVTTVLVGCTKDDILNDPIYKQVKSLVGCAALERAIEHFNEYETEGKIKFPTLFYANKTIIESRYQARCITE